jgi:tRNA(adenine34) deaminase
MCLGALINARIERIVFGAKNTKNGFCGSLVDMTNDSQFNHRPIVTGGILEKQCQEILRSFFRLRR